MLNLHIPVIPLKMSVIFREIEVFLLYSTHNRLMFFCCCCGQGPKGDAGDKGEAGRPGDPVSLFSSHM